MKINIYKTLTTLINRTNQKHYTILSNSLDKIDLIKTSSQEKQGILSTIEKMGYKDIHHFMELLSLEHFNINISDKYYKELKLNY